MVLNEDELQARSALIETLKALGHEPPQRLDLRGIPFSGQWGLATSVCMQLSRGAANGEVPEGLSKKEQKRLIESRSRERAQSLADEVADRLRQRSVFSDVQAVNGYVNMFFDTSNVARRLLAEVHDSGEGYGRGEPKTDKVMIEYGQLNTHKQAHVGHLRNISLGDALVRIMEFDGHEVIRATYIGDIGAPVIKWLWGYCKWHRDEPIDADDGPYWERVYVEANSAIKENPEYDREYREMFARWDRQDPEVVELWERTRELSLTYLRRVFDDLGVRFDAWFYESQFESPGKQVVRELLNRGIAEIDEGAPVVHIDQKLGLSKDTYRTALLQRSDGTSLYFTKELALTRAKFDQYNVDTSLNVVDVRQSLYFQQVFKVLELFGYEQAANSAHVPYEYVTLATGPMSSRQGNTISYDEFAADMFERTLSTVREKNPDMSEDQQREIASDVSVGSMKFGMLDRDNTKLLVFDREEALDFDGFSAPYVQYAHARACRILEKAPEADWTDLRPENLSTPEINLLEAIGGLGESVSRAAREHKPLHLVNYVYNLAKVFNEFYRESPVLRAEDDVRNYRLALVHATRTALANGLRLLGIPAPEVM